VVIGDDATPEARLAGDLASQIGALYGAEITLLEAMQLDGGIAEAASWMGPVRELFEDRLQDRADDLETAFGSRPTVRLVDGPAAAALVDVVSTQCGRRTLMALGTGRRAGLAGVLHPSVALAVADAATGPVLVSPVGQLAAGAPRRPLRTLVR
jgi:nucleotide-binding universal stress UspA family protein